MLKILAEAEGELSSANLLTLAVPPTDLPSILRREAVYCAMGRLSRALQASGGVDFGAFLRGASAWLGQPLPMYACLFQSLNIVAETQLAHLKATTGMADWGVCFHRRRACRPLQRTCWITPRSHLCQTRHHLADSNSPLD